jgi:ankyrin repeat protein
MELLHKSGEILAQRYRILEPLGEGGSGTTYQAEDLPSGQRVALKALSLRRMTDWKMMELFEREAHVLAQLNHPAIPRYLKYFYIDTAQERSFYIAQQLAPGQSLASLVQQGWRASEQEVRGIAIQILEILVYLHSLDPPVIHRDIKPQNIIRHDDGQVFLVDFGAVAETYHSTLTRSSTVVGTFGYMAPEQFIGQAVPATDLYGLAATLLFLLTHRSPAELPTDRLKIDFRSRVQISDEFADWLERMLEPDVEDRFLSAKEALAALQRDIRELWVTTEGTLGVNLQKRLGVMAGVVATAAISAVTVGVFNSLGYPIPILNSLGIAPTGLCKAMYRGDIKPIRDYLERGGNPNAVGTDMFLSIDTPSLLHCASASPNKDAAELLIAKGADVNTWGKSGITPLDSAVQGSRLGKDKEALEVAELLIAKGADVNAKNNERKKPFKRNATEYNNIYDRMQYSGRPDKNNTPLHRVAITSWEDMAKLLLSNGADANVKNSEGSTPLHYTASRTTGSRRNRTGMAELLLANGADVNAKDNDGQTPLHWIGGYESDDMVKLLIINGADVNAKDNEGKTPLHWMIARYGSDDMVELLIANGADVNAKDNEGKTPLHWAVREGRKDMVELLKRHGATE